MMSEIQNCVLRLIKNANSLLENKTNNICEQFNSVINKHIGGKQIHFSGRGNYNTRVEADSQYSTVLTKNPQKNDN